MEEIFHALIFVDELFLKGRNRQSFFKQLEQHIQKLGQAKSGGHFKSLYSHPIIVATSDQPLSPSFFKAAQKIPGIFAILPAIKIDRSADPFPLLREKLAHLIKAFDPFPQTFRVSAQRADKTFPMNSQTLNQQVGGVVLDLFPQLKVNLNQPELTVELRIFRDAIYLAVEKYPGIGGQPVGMSGHVISLLSGGFDSPVASVMMSKRGCKQTLLFFYARPFVGPAVLEKIKTLASELSKYQLGCALAIIPFGSVQQAIAQNCRNEYRTLFIRIFMTKCAALLAKDVNALALVTGDSLSQVSSQTIWNLCTLDRVSPLPIFRPLLGFNKSEILKLARQFNLYDISAKPHDDACALFAPTHPIIKSDPVLVQKFMDEHSVQFDERLKQACTDAEVWDFDILGNAKIRSQQK
jgi:thiamine biosynthesis protein ThiI